MSCTDIVSRTPSNSKNPSGINMWWRLRWASIGGVLVVCLVVATWGIAHLIRTPQDILADTAPPPPSRITFPIIERRLQPDVVVSGSLASRRTVKTQLGVDQRQALPSISSIVVILPSAQIAATVKSRAANGEETLALGRAASDPKGTAVRVRFVSSNRNVKQLSVPISALFATPSGAAAVVVVDGSSERQVEVNLGLRANGYVGITAVRSSALHEGEQVLVSEPGG